MSAKERIEALLREHGYGACFVKQYNNSHRAARRQDWRVIAIRGRFRCQIAMLHAIEAMSEDELAALIAVRLASQKARKS